MAIMGFKAVMGSWKIMEIRLPRMACIWGSFMSRRDSPLKRMLPLRISPVRSGNSRSTERAVVVFPAPVSPTSPRVSPFSSCRFTPLRAWTTMPPLWYITFRS